MHLCHLDLCFLHHLLYLSAYAYNLLISSYLHLLYSTSDFIITGEVNIVATLVSWATSRSKFGTNKSFGAFGAPRELKGAMAPLPFRSADASPNESNDPNKQTIADDIILQIIVVC